MIMDSSQMPGGAHLIQTPIVVSSKRNKLRSVSPPTPTPSRSARQSEAASHPDSPDSAHNGADSKRRRFTSSPVRPWKSPSPQSNSSIEPPPGVVPQVTPASNLLRHISVIRETPPILKPQVVAPSYHVPHAAHHHYHHLVDPYAAAYHLYKNGAGQTGAMTGAPPTATSAAGHSHHWGAYN